MEQLQWIIVQEYRCQQAIYALQFIGCIALNPGTHQVDELVVMKADCGVGSHRQRLGPKLPWNTKPTLDTRRPSSTFVLCLSSALVHQLNSQSEWPDSTCQIGRKKANKDQLQPTVRNTLTKLSWLTNKKLPYIRLLVWCVLGLKEHHLKCHSRNFCKTCLFL